MNKYIIHDTDGKILSCGMSSDRLDQRISDDCIQVYIDFPEDIENYKYDIATGTIVRLEQSIIDARQANHDWEMLRGVRDSKLAASDWTQAADSPLTDAKKAEWRTYRQALRDITDTSDPTTVTWPSQPT